MIPLKAHELLDGSVYRAFAALGWRQRMFHHGEDKGKHYFVYHEKAGRVWLFVRNGNRPDSGYEWYDQGRLFLFLKPGHFFYQGFHQLRSLLSGDFQNLLESARDQYPTHLHRNATYREFIKWL